MATFAACIALIMAVTPSASHAAAGVIAPSPLRPSVDTETPLLDNDATEPFGLPSHELAESPLTTKWQAVREAIDAEMNVVVFCRFDLTLCPSPAAIEFLAIVRQAQQRDGLARLGEINRAINLDVKPVADIDQYQVEDYWSSPLVTLAAGAGDCEDYAIAKFVALREAGIPSADLRVVILRDQHLHADHAVVAVRADHRWRILDSRRLQMLDDAQFLRFQTMSHFEPVFVIGDTGVRRYDDQQQSAADVATASPAALMVAHPALR